MSKKSKTKKETSETKTMPTWKRRLIKFIMIAVVCILLFLYYFGMYYAEH